MTAITIRQFNGIAPRIPARYLKETQAQTALNCPTWLGSLAPLTNSSQVATFSKSGTIQSIYRFGQDVDSQTQYWFHWTEDDVDVVRGFINGDTTERTFFSGVGAPKVTNNTLALTGGGTDYPIASYMLGVPQPDADFTTVSVNGSAETGALPETRTYTYTLVNAWGEESAPYAPSTLPDTHDVALGQTVDLTFPSAPGGSWDPEYRRVYRSVSGVYSLVYVDDGAGGYMADIPIGDTTVTDSATADQLGEEMSSLTWLPPDEDLTGLVGMPGGVLAGFVGIDVYFCEPYRPFAWPLQYQQSVGYAVVGLGVIDTTLVVLTVGKPFFIQGSEPAAMAVVEADVSQACASKKSIVSMNGAVLYASPDGLIALAPGGSRIITQDRFDKAQWQALFDPESIEAYAYEDLYVAFYDNGVTQGGFIYDTASGEFTVHGVYATGGYADLLNDTLYLVVSNALHAWGAGSALTYTWRSKKFTFPDLIAFTCFRVNAETYPITFSLYQDGTLYHTESVTSSDIRRLPTGYGHDYEIELSGTGEVYAVQVGQSPREIASG